MTEPPAPARSDVLPDSADQGRSTPWLARVPRWVWFSLGVIAVVVGILLATRPLTSLSALALTLGAGFVVLGAATLLDGRGRHTGWEVARGLAWVGLGLLVLVWLRHSFDLLALAVGVVLVASGGARLWTAVRGQRPGGPRRGTHAEQVAPTERVANGLQGVAELILGVLAVRWPDLTLLAVAVIFAVRLVLLGLRMIRRALSRGAPTGETGPTAYSPSASTPGRTWPRLVGSALALVLALGAASLGVQARGGAPVVDAFYATPATVPADPGVLLRSEAFTRDVPEGASGWRILYTTTAADGSAATASALMVVPTGVGAGPVPVIAWAHGTTGFATQCAPSLLEHPFEAGAMPALDQVVERGWAVVATDYTGLGTPGPHPYLVGPGEAYSVLDALRAARQVEGTNLAPETVVWGHSQGGHAALWTGQLAAGYAPELSLSGVVAMAPAADVEALAESLPGSSIGALFASYVIASYAGRYPEITLDEQVIPPARTLVREMSGRCLAEPSILVSLVSVLSLARDQSVYASPPAEGALGERLRENTPTGPFPMPVLVAQGEADTLILPVDQQGYVDRLCAAGESVAYRTYPDQDHLSVVAAESELIDDLLQWTTDAFEGTPAAQGCS